jgi:thiamine-phosphate pyrophosphorylase
MSDLGRRPGFDKSRKPQGTDLLLANMTRAKESARILEEILKVHDVHTSRCMKEIRFTLYDMEKRIASVLNRTFDPRLYVILDEQYMRSRDVVTTVRALERHGATMLQLRVSALSDRKLLACARRIKAALRRPKTKFIINNRVDIALACGADGVHLGQRDMPVDVVRRLTEDGLIIGTSVHTPSQAHAAVRKGADYLGVGAVYASVTKPESRVRGLDVVREISSAVAVPVIGIGGITAQNIQAVINAGAAGVAVSRYVFEGNLVKNMRALTQNQ